MKLRNVCYAAMGALALCLGACQQPVEPQETAIAERWSEEQANAWYAKLPWLAGVDYINASSINQIEMWSQDTYKADEIDKELGWAEELGFNTLRVYLSSVVYENDPEGLKERMDNFLTICQKTQIKQNFTIFDDCWDAESA